MILRLEPDGSIALEKREGWAESVPSHWAREPRQAKLLRDLGLRRAYSCVGSGRELFVPWYARLAVAWGLWLRDRACRAWQMVFLLARPDYPMGQCIPWPRWASWGWRPARPRRSKQSHPVIH